MSLMVPEVAPMSRAEIEADARKVIERFHPGLLDTAGEFPIVDFFDHDLPEAYGLSTGVAELGDGIEGLTFPDGRVQVSEETYTSAVRGNGRARFTIAHEAYHGIRHRNQIRRQMARYGELTLKRRVNVPAFRDPEWQANVFAAALLMPADAVRALAAEGGPRGELTGEIQRRFGVSWSAAEIRIDTLRIG